MKRQKVIKTLGNICIIISLAGFLFIFYPLIGAYFLPEKNISRNELQHKKGIYITIPKIHAQAQIILNVDPWNEREYREALKHGVAHAKGTALPGEKGTTFLFAHSSGDPWELTYTNTLFLRLGELNVTDKIIINKDGKEETYQVTNKKEVWPNEVNYLQNTVKDNNSQLILQTCTPIGTSLKRLLVFATKK